LALGTASLAAAQPGVTPAPSFSPPHPAVVRVVVPERDGTAYGSGALVALSESTGLVVTNWHVVRDAAGPITVMFPGGFHSPASVLRTDRDWDLAALAVWRPNVAPIALSSAAPRPGDVLTIAGYGSGSYRAVAGRCTQYVSPGNNQPFEMVELAAPARNGDSGGPILNERGELAGVLFGSAYGRTTGSYCGRLRLFLGSVDGDFQRVSSQAMVAQQQQQPRNPAPVAAIPAAMPVAVPAPVPPTTPMVAPPAGPIASQVVAAREVLSPVGPIARTLPAETDVGRTLPAPVAAIAPAPVGPLPSTDQIKTILAAIGIIAVIYQALRLLGWAIG
jgi:S1-C subfamily serine protease